MNKILVTRIGGIGDVVMTTAVITGLKELYPHSHITYLVAPNAVDAVQGLSCVDEVIAFRKDFKTQLHILNRIWHFDMALFADVTYRSAVLAALARIPLRIGLAHKRGQWLTHPIKWEKYMDSLYDPETVAQWLFMASGIDVTKTPAWPAFQYAEATHSEQQRVDDLVASCGIRPGDDYLVAALHASGDAKDWPEEQWRTFFGMLRENGIETPIVLVGDKPSPTNLGEHILDLAGKTNLRELGAVIKHASFFIGGCSLPMHVARAFHVPAIGLYGPNPVTKGAPPELVAAHMTKHTCAPCEGYYSGACEHPDCMASIAPEEVFNSFICWWKSHKEC